MSVDLARVVIPITLRNKRSWCLSLEHFSSWIGNNVRAYALLSSSERDYDITVAIHELCRSRRYSGVGKMNILPWTKLLRRRNVKFLFAEFRVCEEFTSLCHNVATSFGIRPKEMAAIYYVPRVSIRLH